MHNTVLVRYGEIGLKKGRTRYSFEKRLLKNMKDSVKKHAVQGEFRKEWGRIFFDTQETEKACQALSRVFGVVSCSPCWMIEFEDLEEIVKACEKYTEGKVNEDQTFAIRSSRAGNHEFTSMDIARECGSVVIDAYSPSVDLDEPDVELHVETRQKRTYFFSQVVDGPGGLPIGVEGKVVCLISGGIDSPVAAWMMMKRGCEPVFVNFELQPFCDDRQKEKSQDVLEVLKEWTYGYQPKTYFIPHGENLTEFLKSAPRKKTCVLCKRIMLMIGERIALKEKAQALVTGESLGQVASQTLQNINVEDRAVRMPVFRPLIGFDKTEIIDLAKKIGSYEPSTSPAESCTAVPEHPETSAELSKIEDEENFVKINELVNKSLKNARIE